MSKRGQEHDFRNANALLRDLWIWRRDLSFARRLYNFWKGVRNDPAHPDFAKSADGLKNAEARIREIKAKIVGEVMKGSDRNG